MAWRDHLAGARGKPGQLGWEQAQGEQQGTDGATTSIEALHRDVDSSEGSYPRAGSNNRAGYWLTASSGAHGRSAASAA